MSIFTNIISISTCIARQVVMIPFSFSVLMITQKNGSNPETVKTRWVYVFNPFVFRFAIFWLITSAIGFGSPGGYRALKQKINKLKNGQKKKISRERTALVIRNKSLWYTPAYLIYFFGKLIETKGPRKVSFFGQLNLFPFTSPFSFFSCRRTHVFLIETTFK